MHTDRVAPATLPVTVRAALTLLLAGVLAWGWSADWRWGAYGAAVAVGALLVGALVAEHRTPAPVAAPVEVRL